MWSIADYRSYLDEKEAKQQSKREAKGSRELAAVS
jgi:hypothetical protein